MRADSNALYYKEQDWDSIISVASGPDEFKPIDWAIHSSSPSENFPNVKVPKQDKISKSNEIWERNITGFEEGTVDEK